MKVEFERKEEIRGPRLWNIQPLRDLFWLSLWVFVLYMVYWFSEIFFPVFTALLLAYLFQPIVHKAKVQLKWPKPFTATIIILSFILAVALLIVGFWPLLQDQMKALGEKVPAYLQATANRFGYTLDLNAQIDIASLGLKLENPQEILQEVLNRTGQAFNFLTRFINATSAIVLNAVLIPIYFFFFCWRFDAGARQVMRCVPLRYQGDTRRIAQLMDYSVAGFFRGRLVVSAIVIFLYAFGWYLADVPYWFILGLLAGILNIIPYASGIFWPVAVLLKYVDTLTVHPGDSSFLSIVVWPSLVFFIVQFLEGWVLTPWVQGEQMEMSVPTVLIVVFIGGSMGGFLGLLLCLPIYACLKILYKELLYPGIMDWTMK
ncbi:MAG: AI-2E family transporter [Proteobacteria bacterium]|nr:MAG: AI-2E family transporter [Pseudomonadota bacterium]